MNDSAVEWLRRGAPGAGSPQEVLLGLCVRLEAEGVPVERVAVFVATLHPNVIGRRFLWRRGQGVEVDEAGFDTLETEAYRRSTVVEVRSTGTAIRRRLADPGCPIDYSVVDELRAEGMTDYLVMPLPFLNGETHVASWTTKADGGFSDAHLGTIEAVHPPLARLAEIYALRRMAVNLLDTYVGHGAGAQILAGRIRLGDKETIPAVIWLSDMRSFTRLADERPGAEVIALLNDHFGCLVPSIHEHGGEVLKFMGDGLLAIFPVGADEGAAIRACAAACAAVDTARRRTRERNAALREAGLPELRFGLALHVGEVLYGNVGGANRLDFTAIGPAVNLAARLQSLTAEKGYEVVASGEFAGRCGDRFEPLGAHPLRGFRNPVSVYRLREEA